MARKKRKAYSVEKPPEGCYHYDLVGDVPWDIQKCARYQQV